MKKSWTNIFRKSSDHFYILTRDGGLQTKRSVAILKKLGFSYSVIVDKGDDIPRWAGIINKKKNGPSAYGRAFEAVIASKTIPDRVWLIEDDVHLHLKALKRLVRWTRRHAPTALCTPVIFRRPDRPDWVWFKDTESKIGMLNQLVSIPRPVVETILRSSQARFHEYWFPECAQQCGAEIICWQETKMAELFGKWHVGPNLNEGPGLRHPVKRVASEPFF